MVIADASVIIALAKTGKLNLLREVYGDVLIGPVVKNEVVDRGKAVAAPEVAYVEKAMEEKWVRVARPGAKEKRLTQKLLNTTGLDEGEAESLALAGLQKGMLLVDDKEGRTMADAMGIEYVGTAGVLLEAFIKGIISYDGLEQAVRDLTRVIWLSPDVVAEILRKANEVRR